MKDKKLIAVTGGIGSGKSSACEIIRQCGYPVLSCDQVYAELLDSGAFNAVFMQTFGDVFDERGRVDRKKLAAVVFRDKSMLAKLNAVTHPVIMQEVYDRAKNHPVAFVEVQLLFETGLQTQFDDIIVVTRLLQQRIQAVMQRSNLTREEVETRIVSQFDYDSVDLSSYYVVENNGTLAELSSSIKDVLKKLI